ncbi:hypothetical protein AX17_002087 [Amanita inopinata Kibby_2008]|nr:hypothetical protein AX17_002087 [Amanita inopinata Kibby_2008]
MSFLVSVWRPLAYISLPLILLRAIARSSPLGRYYTRVAVYLSALVSVATCSSAIAAGMTLIGRQYDTNYVVARTFYTVCKKVMNLRVEVEGEEYLTTTRPAVLMMNHQSMLDVLIVGRLMPKQTSIMSKKSLQYSPLGPFMTMSGAIFIDRANSSKAVHSLDAAGQLMKAAGISLWMFPEGTRHSAEIPDMLPLKKGGFHLALQAGIPIIPIVAENYWRMYRKGVFEEGKLKVRVLPPVSTSGLTAADVSTLAISVRNQMVETLREISVKVPSGQTERESKPEDGLSSSTLPQAGPPPSARPTTEIPSSTSIPTTTPEQRVSKQSSSSLAMSSSTSSLNTWKSGTSEPGVDTEEDEGMVLVGRPV